MFTLEHHWHMMHHDPRDQSRWMHLYDIPPTVRRQILILVAGKLPASTIVLGPATKIACFSPRGVEDPGIGDDARECGAMPAIYKAHLDFASEVHAWSKLEHHPRGLKGGLRSPWLTKMNTDAATSV